MSLKKPTSDQTRLTTLGAILRFSREAVAPETPLEPDTPMEVSTEPPTVSLPDHLNRELEQCYDKMRVLFRKTEAIQERIKEEREKRNALSAKARSHLRSYWKALNLYMETHPLSKSPLAFYGMVDGKTVKPPVDEVLRIGKEILLAVTNAEAAGMPVITLGEAQEAFAQGLSKLEKSLVELSTLEMADTELTDTKVKVRRACDSVHSASAAYLRYSYRGYSNAAIREKMRAYGFKFKSDGRQTQAADATAAEGTSSTSPDARQATTGANQQ